MHVLYFHQHFSTPSGSTGTRSYEMAQALIRNDHEVTMVCGSYRSSETGLHGESQYGCREGNVDGIEVIELCLPYSNHDGFFKRSITFLRFALKSIYIAIVTPYDLLFATSTPLTAGIPGIVMRLFKPRLPFIFEVRDLWPELPKAMGVIRNPFVLKIMSFLEWLSYHSAKGCIALSPGIQQGILQRCPHQKVAMIPNGCDLNLFIPRSNPEIQNNEKLKAVFTGAHGIANGLDAILDAAVVLQNRKRTDIEIFLVGDGKKKPELIQKAHEYSLFNCRFLDPVPKNELANMVTSFDVGLMVLSNVPAFYYGTSPNKFFDYISSGLPVINNYPGWLAELIQEHECGIAVSPGDPVEFANALEYLADNPNARIGMGKRARKLAETCFDRKTLASEFVQFVEDMNKY